MHRNPATIAAELATESDSLGTAFLPAGVKTAISLSAEFVAATAAALIAAGIIPDPEADHVDDSEADHVDDSKKAP